MKNTLFLLLFDIKNDIIKNISKGGIMESYNFAERKEENNKYYSAGMKEYHNKNWLKAIEYLEKSLKLEEKYYRTYFTLGKCYLNIHKKGKGEELFKEVIELDQKNVYARLELGKLYAKQGKEKEKEEEKLLDKEIPRSTEKENRGKKLESSNIEENNKYIIQKGIKQESKGNTKTSSTSRVKENKEKQAKKIGEIIRENTKSAVNKIGITYYAKMRLCSDKAEDIHKETERVRKYIKKYDKLQSILECSEGNKRAKMELMLVLINEGYSKIVENEYPDEYKFINSLVEEYKKREKTADVVKKEIDEYSL